MKNLSEYKAQKKNELSLFFEIFTSLGYGHSTPATKLGKVFTISYACLGIPIAMIMFQVEFPTMFIIVVVFILLGYGLSSSIFIIIIIIIIIFFF